MERQINEDLRRSYCALNWWELFERRRVTFEKLIESGHTYNVQESMKLFERVIKANGYEVKKFVTDVMMLIDKVDNKRNCLYIQGKSNSMKSTIARTITTMVPIAGQQIMSREFAFYEPVRILFLMYYTPRSNL